MTLKELLDEHPEWADLPIVLLNTVGEYEWLGASALVYEGKVYEDSQRASDGQKVVVFAAN